MESNSEMNDNQIAGVIYAEIAGRVQNTTQNNQGSGGENTGAQGETAGAETEAAVGEIAYVEQQESGGAVLPASGESTQENESEEQAIVPASGGMVQPGRTETDTIGAEDGRTTEPAIESEIDAAANETATSPA